MTTPIATELQSRSTTFDLHLPAESDQWQTVVDSIRQYRAVCRQVFSIFATAQAAGATINAESGAVTPNTEAARTILATATGKVGKALAYELRDHVLRDLCPSWMSFVWDSCRRDVATAWTAKDPEITKASRGWLVLQGARGLSQFNNRGIGFPAATGRPKLEASKLRLKWDKAIDEVEFRLGTLDPGRWHVWKSIRDGDDGWSLGTIYLNERDGKLRATISHQRPPDLRDVDPASVCRIRVHGDDPDLLISIAGPNGVATYDRIDSQEVRAWLARHEQKRMDLEARRAACGSKNRPWGHRAGFRDVQAVIAKATRQRTLGATDRNHAWTRRIVTRATAWRCGTVALSPLPEKLAGHPWAWSQFVECLRYKCRERGIVLVETDSDE